MNLTRRHFLKTSAVGLAAGTMVQRTMSAAAAPADARPNVILIMTDDQGYGDIAAHGNPVVQTPSMDRLHAEGVRLTDYHVTPVCTPTRGQLLTGMDALRNGARAVPGGINTIWRELPTMPEIFRDGGYRTGLFGKWHLGDTYPDRPMDKGFERSVWIRGWGVQSAIEYDNDYVNLRYLDELDMVHGDRYATDVWFEEAINWMDQQRKTDEPFFVYLPTLAPHGPWWAPEEELALYADQPEPSASFLAMITRLDRNLGRLMDWLAETGLEDNTILIFKGDNGTVPPGRRVYDGGLRGAKAHYTEGGHRVFNFVRWAAGGIAGGRDINQPTQVQDLLPTLIELCELPEPAADFDGISLAQVLQDPAASLPERMLVVQYGGRVAPVKGEGCVIWNQWRLVNYHQLYDVEADLAQEHDVAEEHSEVVERMQAFYDRWWAERETRAFERQPYVIGSEHENPVMLEPNMWEGVDQDNTWLTARADTAGSLPGYEPERGGLINIDVARSGAYRMEMRRWPFHTNEPIGSTEGVRQTVSGRPLEMEFRETPAAEVVLAINGRRHIQKVDPTQPGVTFENIELDAGYMRMQAWFRDANGEDLCGVFFIEVERL